MANTPVFLTSFVATSARLLINLEQTFCFSSNLSANALAMLLFVIARAVALVVAFMGLLVLGNIVRCKQKSYLYKHKCLDHRL